jgi:hypothetical protein
MAMPKAELQAVSLTRYRGASRRALWPAASEDSFPHLPTMNGNLFVDLKAQAYLAALNLEHGDFEHVPEAIAASDDNGFLHFP